MGILVEDKLNVKLSVYFKTANMSVFMPGLPCVNLCRFQMHYTTRKDALFFLKMVLTIHSPLWLRVTF